MTVQYFNVYYTVKYCTALDSAGKYAALPHCQSSIITEQHRNSYKAQTKVALSDRSAEQYCEV